MKLAVTTTRTDHPRLSNNALILALGICLLSLSCLGADSPANAPPKIALQSVVSGFTTPLGLQVPNDGTGRLFVLEQGGNIRIIQNGVLLATPFSTDGSGQDRRRRRIAGDGVSPLLLAKRALLC